MSVNECNYDHLGNVRTVIADYKNPDPTYTSSPIQFWRYFADVKNISNMYPYGKLYGTNAIYNAAEDYRYGFNGMEKEPLPLFNSFSISR